LTFNGKQQIPLPAYFSFLKISFQFLIFFFGLQENEVDKEGEYGLVKKKGDYGCKEEELCLKMSFLSKMDEGDLKTTAGGLTKEKVGMHLVQKYSYTFRHHTFYPQTEYHNTSQDSY
jgi:hypothetical protein